MLILSETGFGFAVQPEIAFLLLLLVIILPISSKITNCIESAIDSNLPVKTESGFSW